jgi:hypothetical protein
MSIAPRREKRAFFTSAGDGERAQFVVKTPTSGHQAMESSPFEIDTNTPFLVVLIRSPSRWRRLQSRS